MSKDLKELFNQYDPNDTGFISLIDMKHILHEYARGFNVVLEIQDIGEHNQISFAQFQEYFERNAKENFLYYSVDGRLNWNSNFAPASHQKASQQPQHTEDVPLDVVIDILKQLSSNDGHHDGTISFASFLKFHNPDSDGFRTLNLKV